MICMHPTCSAQVKAPRLICTAHWRELPDEIRGGIRARLFAGGARIFLSDYYQSQLERKTNGNHHKPSAD